MKLTSEEREQIKRQREFRADKAATEQLRADFFNGKRQARGYLLAMLANPLVITEQLTAALNALDKVNSL